MKDKQISESELVGYVEGKLQGTKDSIYDMQNYLNLAYYSGKQWITFDDRTNQLYEPPKESHKVRLVANKIQPIVRTELAKITKNKPIMVAIPATSEEKDENSSRIVEKFLEYLEYTLDLQERDRECILWGLCCGTGWVKAFWNPNKGDKVQDPETGEIFKTGDIDIDIISPFELRYDKTAKKFSEIQWMCHNKIRTTDYVKNVYGKDVQSESGLINTNIYETKLQNLNNNFSTSTIKSSENSVLVKEYWEMPSFKYKNGRRITVASNVVLFYEEDIGFGDFERKLPFFPFNHIQIPSRLEGMSIIEQLIPIQREYNKTRSQLIEYKNLMAFPQWITENGSLNGDITDEPGAIIEYKAGRTPPRVVDIPSISSDVYRNIELCDQEFYFISGQQETSHGGTPPGVTSGVAIRYLQEQDDTKISPSISNWIDTKKKYMTYMIELAKYYYNIPRKIKIVGEDKKVEIIEFQGSDITTADIRVEQGSLFQASRSAKQQYVFDLIGSGVLNAVKDRSLILKMLELGVIDDVFNESQLDVQQAQNEEIKWSHGNTETLTRDFFNHQVHIDSHNKYRKKNYYVESSDEMKAFVDAHVLEHEQYLYRIIQKEVMKQQQIQQPQQETKTNINNITVPNVPLIDAIQGLTPEEQQKIYDNPEILNKYRDIIGGV